LSVFRFFAYLCSSKIGHLNELEKNPNQYNGEALTVDVNGGDRKLYIEVYGCI